MAEGRIRHRKHQAATSSDASDDTGDESRRSSTSTSGSSGHRTCIILRVPCNTKREAVEWLVDKVRGQRAEGGAELVVRQQPARRHGQELALHVSASKIKLLETAEQLELRKRDRHGCLRDFTVAHLEDFLLDDVMTLDDLLTVAEKQTIIRHELENVRAQPQDTHVPGYPTYSLYEGQSIIQICLQQNIITQIYPLHDKEELKKLGHKWYRTFFKKQPIEDVRVYFGEGIALYCTFLGFYTKALLIPMCFGFIQLLASSETVPFFCIFNVIWTTVFLEIWKRRSNELAFNWGTIGMTSLDEPRANYHGLMCKDPVSGKIQPWYPRWKTNLKMYFVSIPIVFICMVFAFIIMLASFWCEDLIRQYDSEYKAQLLQMPSIVYAALVYLMNAQYRKLATALTEWENHRTQSQYDRHRVTKLVMFEFVNNFMSLFYIAFITQDLEMLRHQLAVMLIIQQAINNVQEAILPLAMEKLSSWKQKISLSKPKVKCENLLPEVPVVEDPDACAAADAEGDSERYEGTFDDYLEMFVQFGYVVLFSSVYPAAAFWAVLNNLVEIRADAFKLCRVLQRPMARRVKDIGAWQRAFEVVGALSIMTNCGLLALSPTMRARFGVDFTDNSLSAAVDENDTDEEVTPYISGVTWVLAFVALEHILLGVRFILHKAIPDRPEWVRVELARRMHESRRALRNERNHNSRHILQRRFRTVHGPHQHNSSRINST